MAKVHPIVLAGGAGTRLWPMSTPERPKHLLELIGEKTLVQQTVERFADRAAFEPPVIICAAGQAEAIADAAPGCRLIVEPVPRGSAAAVALACLAAEPDAVLLVLPSDHHIRDPAPLFAAIESALPAAQAGHLITFGIRPARAETGYGYITSGAAIDGGVLQASSFVEKPPSHVAEALLSSGTAYWNSGIFLFTAGALLDELERHAPAIQAATRASMDGARREATSIFPAVAPLESCPSTSIDYAVMEHSDRIAVVPIDLEWSDVGSWAAVYDLSAADADRNVVSEGSHALDSSGCLIRSEGPRIVAVGVHDLVIVATADHVLVVPRSEAQRVREAAELAGRR